jgi:hypothetical protein
VRGLYSEARCFRNAFAIEKKRSANVDVALELTSETLRLAQDGKRLGFAGYFVVAASIRRNRAALLYKMSRFSSGVRYSAF